MSSPLTLEAVYDAHGDFVLRALRRLGVPDGDVPDAIQEVFLVVHRKLSTFEGRSTLRTWLFGIASRVAADRRKRAHVRREVKDEERVERELDPGANAEDQALLAEDRALLERALGSLRDEQRLIFVLYEIEAMTGAEIAEALSIPPGTVMSRLRLAREAFRETVARLGAQREFRPLRPSEAR